MNEDGGEDPMGIDRWSRALSWHAALREADEKELTNSVGREWQEWYADAENRQIFDDVSRLLADRYLYRRRRRRTSVEVGDDSYDLSVPISEWRRTRALQESRKQSLAGGTRWWLWGGMGVAAIAVLILWWPRQIRFGGEARRVVYQTEIGELKDIHLSDGTSIILGGRTELTVALSAQRRSVSVIEGQAWFRVAHDADWPFIVTAGDGTITDIGTAFLVTRESDRVVVSVTEGTVEVSPRQLPRPSSKLNQEALTRPALAPIRVSGGEQLTLSDNGSLGPIKQTDTHAATAWIHGRLTFDDQPLRYVIETVNRYSSLHIIVSPSAGALRFSGIISDDEIGDWLQSLEVIFPVSVEEQGANVRIRMHYSKSEITVLQRNKQRDRALTGP